MKKIQLYEGGQVAYPTTDSTYDDIKNYRAYYTDDALLDVIFNNAQFGDVIMLSNRKFEVHKQHNIPYGVSLIMQPYTQIKAIAPFTGDYVLKYVGNPNAADLVLYQPNGEVDNHTNIGLFNGIIDGNGLASCLWAGNLHHYTIRDVSLHNGKIYGLYVGGARAYELFAYNVYAKTLINGCEGNVGFNVASADCHFIDCLAIDYTIGIRLSSGATKLTRCHVWGGIVGYPNSHPTLDNSINFDIQADSNVLTDCYADTAKIGFNINGSGNRLIGCDAFNNYSRFGLDGVTYYNILKNDTKLIGCRATATAPNTTIITGTGTREIIGCTGFPQ